MNTEDYETNSAISGDWWNPERSGEGFIIDVANHGLVVVASFTYDNYGNQLWLIGPGDVDGSVVEIDLEMAEGGHFGSLFDPDTIVRTEWGTATFTFFECGIGRADIYPNEALADEYETFSTDISGLTVPVNCAD